MSSDIKNEFEEYVKNAYGNYLQRHFSGKAGTDLSRI